MALRRFVGIWVALAAVFVLAACGSPEDRDWAEAKRYDGTFAYEQFIANYPDSEHLAEAQAGLVRAKYFDAAVVGTVPAMQAFLDSYPGSAQTADAEAHIAVLRADRSLFEQAAAANDEYTLRQFLVNFPGHAAEAEARELLRPFDGIDLFELLAAGEVDVDASGAGVAGVNLTLRNLSQRQTKVIVPAGALFESGNADVQSMVTTAPAEIWLSADGVTTQYISAACANLHLAEPSGSDGLTLAAQPLVGELAQVLAGTSALDLSARQAAVWIMTDDATYSELTVLNTMSAAHAAAGAKLVADSGVDLTKRRIWEDRETLLDGSLFGGDEDTGIWLWTAMGRPHAKGPSPEYEIPYAVTAAQCSCFAFLDALIASGADLNQRFTGYGEERSVISHAAGDRAMVERMLEVGAALDARGLWEEAVRRRSSDVVAFLIERDEPPPADLPLLAYAQGDVPLLRMLLDQGQPLDAADEYGGTGLSAAVRNAEAVALLLAAGADPNARSPNGMSALEAAAWETFANDQAVEVIGLLLAAGADPQVRDAQGDTLLHIIVEDSGDVTAMQRLLDAGLDPNVANDFGRTPLHAVVESANYNYSAAELATALVNAGARRLRDINGRLPEDLFPDDYYGPEELRAILARAPE